MFLRERMCEHLHKCKRIHMDVSEGMFACEPVSLWAPFWVSECVTRCMH